MSYDLNILVVGEENHVNISLATETDIELLDESQENLRYHGIWGFMTATHGMWYSLGTESESGFSALRFLEPDFDSRCEAFPYWINGGVESNLVPMLVKSEYQEDLKRIFEMLSSRSPVNTVYVMARMQGGDDEIICGVLSHQQFWELHDARKISFNVCYILKD